MRGDSLKKEWKYLLETPYHLEEEDVEWVQNTIQDMTVKEKAAQLFIVMNDKKEEDKVKEFLQDYPVGGIRYRNMEKEDVMLQNQMFQKYSKIPPFIAANCECGPNEVYKGAPFIATEAELGAAGKSSWANQAGAASGEICREVGVNWTFSPIVDVYLNGKNTIVNSRSYGDDPDQILELSKAYIQGVHEHPVLCCAKHFPGDGVDDRDQHLVMSVNDQSCEEWDQTNGKVYQELIDEGLETIMAGHIALPSYCKKLNPKLTDADILPATLSKELLQGLLRKKMGFKGLIVTDASHMGGLYGTMPRQELVPRVIEAGCDMFLFAHDMEEDLNYMIQGIEKGIITEERLQSALEHILGMKAHLGLHKKQGHSRDTASEQVSRQYAQIEEEIADGAVTLVKDVKNYIPVNPKESPKVRLYFLTNAPETRLQKGNPVKEMVVEELERAGFQVDVNESLYEIEEKEVSPGNIPKIMKKPSIREFRESYDVVFIVVYMHGYSKENSVRVKYSFEHSNEIPWFNCEVPTIGISLNFTNHLYDLPMLKTYINAYAPTRACIRAAIEKAAGKSEFKGKHNDTVWCGRWDTKV